MRADDAAPGPTGLNHICHLSQPNALVLCAGEGTPDEKFFGNFPYPYMNGLLHLGHAFSLSKVSKRLAAGDDGGDKSIKQLLSCFVLRSCLHTAGLFITEHRGWCEPSPSGTTVCT